MTCLSYLYKIDILSEDLKINSALNRTLFSQRIFLGMDSISATAPFLTRSESFKDPAKVAWENVVIKGLPSGQKIRPEILRSWKRCRDIGLDPYSEKLPPVLSGKELNKLLRRNDEIIVTSKPVLDMVEISIKDTGFIVTLSDKDGYVLSVRGDRKILALAERNYYTPGCIRAIEYAGTNAIGLCLTEKKPIQTTGAEHYRACHHPWTCSSAPIYDTQKNIIGVITLSGRSIGQHKHTLAIVTAAAKIVESQLRERALSKEKGRLSSTLTLIFNSISDGVIAIDNDLNITNLNCNAAEMLGLEVGAGIGRRVDKLIQPETSFVHALKRKECFKGREVKFTSPAVHRSFICSVDPIRDTSSQILGVIITIAEKRHLMKLAKEIGGNYAKYQFEDIKGKSPRLLKQIEIAKIAAKTNSRILILGESGTGKELFAQSIHNHSNRMDETFLAISCAAIPRDLIESELFGYRGGAFTGARRDGQIGKFELANKGTLFLDEVDGLPLDLQRKLLRVLQQNEIMRLGATQIIPVNVRVIAASNANLIDEIENSNFREDLYYRLNVVEIVIPPLRERIEDLELLIDHFMKRLNEELRISKAKISDEVLEILLDYSWPGNVRELENCIERAILISQGKTIRKVHLPERIFRKRSNIAYGVKSLNEGNKEIIRATLDRCESNVSRAARELKIGRSTLYRKMKEFGLSQF